MNQTELESELAKIKRNTALTFMATVIILFLLVGGYITKN